MTILPKTQRVTQDSTTRRVELERPQTESANSRRGLTLNQGLVDWRATVNGTPTCSVDGCTRPPRSRKQTLCETHYYRVRRTGATALAPRDPATWNVCSVAECSKLTKTRGGALCNMHYKRASSGYDERQQKRADRDTALRRAYELGASTTQVGQRFGLDPSFVSRTLRDMGVSMRPFGPSGESHPQWVGDHPTYSTAHMRVRSLRGNAKDRMCRCGARAKQWAYLHNDPNELGSREGAYSADPDHYEAMCVSCHKKFDLARIAGTS